MNCQEFQALLDDYLDATLAPASRVAADAHVATCSVCAVLFARGARLKTATAALPRELVPPRDLWPELAARLAAHTRERRRNERYHFIAAAAVLFLTIGTLLTFAQRPFLQDAVPAHVEAASRPAHERNALRARLVAQIVSASGTMSPETRAIVIHNLEVVDRALREIETALANDPNNHDLQRLLTAVYQRETYLINSLQPSPLTIQPTRTDI